MSEAKGKYYTPETDGRNTAVPQIWSPVCRFVLHRLNKNRDVKLIITGKGASTGTGKTTAAIGFARWIHQIQQCNDCRLYSEPTASECRYCESENIEDQQDKWTAKQHGFLDPWNYMEYYTNESSHGEALVQDESEYSIHKRRAMSGENVEMTKIWSALRYKECVSILTLPSTSLIDDMMKQLGDLWFNVVKRGVVYPYVYWYNDFRETVTPYRVKLENGVPMRIHFNSLDGDDEYEKMTTMKDNFVAGEGGIGDVYRKEDLEKAKNKSEQRYRVKITENLLEYSDFSQKDVGSLVHPDPEDSMTQQWVSRVNRGELSAQKEGHDDYPIRE